MWLIPAIIQGKLTLRWCKDFYGRPVSKWRLAHSGLLLLLLRRRRRLFRRGGHGGWRKRILWESLLSNRRPMSVPFRPHHCHALCKRKHRGRQIQSPPQPAALKLFSHLRNLSTKNFVLSEESLSQLAHRKASGFSHLSCGESPRRNRECLRPFHGKRPALSTTVLVEDWRE